MQWRFYDMYDDGDRALGMNKYNDNGDLIEYDVSGAGWVVMGPDDPIAILVGHQGLTWRKEMFLKLVGRFWNKVGGEVISVAKTIPQSGLCSSMCLTCLPASSVKTMQTKTPLSKSPLNPCDLWFKMHVSGFVHLYVLIGVNVTFWQEWCQGEYYHSTENKKQQKQRHIQTSNRYCLSKRLHPRPLRP